MTARGQFDLVGHNLIRYDEFTPGSLLTTNNIVLAPDKPEDEWTRALMLLVGEWRAIVRSTYIRWAMSINGLHVASQKYQSEKNPKQFYVKSLRADRTGRAREEVIALYSFPEAAEAHLKIQPMLCAHGFIDLYAGLEELVFAFYRRFLGAFPENLIKGPEFRHIRKLRREASNSREAEAKWQTAFASRLDDWQRKRIYDGLDRVFVAFCQHAGLQTPSGYVHTTIETWAESIGGVALIRNLLIHGVNTVPKELAEFCEKPHSLGLAFKEGEPLRLRLFELQVFEAFTDQLLTGLNLSLVERAHPKLRDEAREYFKQQEAKETDTPKA